MLDLIRCRGRGAKIAALALAATTMFALVLVATPASAATPADFRNFNPDDSPGDPDGEAEPVVMSDRNDGTNSTYHAVSVATQDTSSVDWYYCPDTYNGGGDPTAGGSGCTLAGTDSSGTTPPGAGSDGVDEVYELNFDVPDDGSHDWVGWFCTTTPKNTTNCDEDYEDDVQFDDSSTGTAASQNPGGELTSPANGSGQSSAGFTLSATTSPDVDEVIFCNTEDADADTEPGTCTDTHTDGTPDNPPAQQSQFKVWSTTGHSFASPNEQAIVLYESVGGATSGLTINCSGSTFDCQLDSHYVSQEPAIPTTAKVAFPDEGEPSTQPNNCDEPEAVNTANEESGSNEDVEGCIFDQSGNTITGDFETAFQMTPIDPTGASTHNVGFNGGEGDDNDLNGDFFFEQIDFDESGPDDPGDIAEHSIHNHQSGAYTVTFCLDSDDNADDFGSPQSATPCSGEALSATGTSNWSQPADHVHVKKQGTEGPQCHTGSSTTTAPAGTTVNLVGCALGTDPGGAVGNEQPASATHVLWIVNPANQPQDPGQIVTQENTTDTAGKADAAISSGTGAAEKTSTIRFCVDIVPAAGGAGQGNGICDSAEGGSAALQADFQINWTAVATPTTPCASGYNRIRGDAQNNLLIGTANCDKIKAKGGDDTSRGKGDNDVLNGGKGFDKANGGKGDDSCPKSEKKKSC